MTTGPALAVLGGNLVGKAWEASAPLLALRSNKGNPMLTCAGVPISSKMVLTAAHCVSWDFINVLNKALADEIGDQSKVKDFLWTVPATTDYIALDGTPLKAAPPIPVQEIKLGTRDVPTSSGTLKDGLAVIIYQNPVFEAKFIAKIATRAPRQPPEKPGTDPADQDCDPVLSYGRSPNSVIHSREIEIKDGDNVTKYMAHFEAERYWPNKGLAALASRNFIRKLQSNGTFINWARFFSNDFRMNNRSDGSDCTHQMYNTVQGNRHYTANVKGDSGSPLFYRIESKGGTNYDLIGILYANTWVPSRLGVEAMGFPLENHTSPLKDGIPTFPAPPGPKCKDPGTEFSKQYVSDFGAHNYYINLCDPARRDDLNKISGLSLAPCQAPPMAAIGNAREAYVFVNGRKAENLSLGTGGETVAVDWMAHGIFCKVWLSGSAPRARGSTVTRGRSRRHGRASRSHCRG